MKSILIQKLDGSGILYTMDDWVFNTVTKAAHPRGIPDLIEACRSIGRVVSEEVIEPRPAGMARELGYIYIEETS